MLSLWRRSRESMKGVHIPSRHVLTPSIRRRGVPVRASFQCVQGGASTVPSDTPNPRCAAPENTH
jgi:hypothetical protein